MTEIEDLRQLLLEVLEYNSETGEIRWKGQAGCIARNGYRYINVGGKQRLAHRVAWLMHYGEWPDDLIDHIDGNRQNNSIGNLRKATYSQNSANAKLHSRNTSGMKGVSYDLTKKKWQATITFQRKQRHLGRYNTREEAQAAYKAAARSLQGDFARSE